jgi:bifunctional UDP-N-acetylglucosamine pyrophosphorylase/glucosamine-1-phosphate N-acetyltransferase
MTRPLAVVVLAAGLGKRTKVSVPKVLLPLCGRTLLDTVLDVVAELKPDRTVVVLHHHKEKVDKAIAGRAHLLTVDQGEPRGTGHAVQVAMESLVEFAGDVMVVYGDCPLITAPTLRLLRDARQGAGASVLTATPDDPTGLGRILRDVSGNIVGIREERDCSEEEKDIGEINAGFYCFDSAHLARALVGLSDDNAQGELYLTDTIAQLVEGPGVMTHTVIDDDEILGVNSLRDLAAAREVMQERILLGHLANGVLIEDPATTYIEHGVEIGKDTKILPCTVIRSGCVIGEGCEVGPFAHLRVSARLDDGAEIGNFVEMKKSAIGRGSKAKHLTYLGDATIGAGVNIGCGTITANYDGKHKHQTHIADGAFIGSGTVLVAPAMVGKNAVTGAGAIVVRGEVPAGEVWVGVPAKPLRKEPRKEGR